ncbi:MAG: sulfotransferase [Gallionella sp.]|nr:sulfotransferase [Gallionella sp.]
MTNLGQFSFTPPSQAPQIPQQPSPMLSIDQAMALANQLQSQGRLQESEHLLQQILQQQPNHPFALHLLGVIAHQVGKNPLAVSLIQKAIQGNGNIALFHANLSEILRQLKRLDEAIAHGERAVALEPQMAMAHSNLGIAYFDRKDYDRAEACQRRALAIDPNFAPSLNNMGSIERERKHKNEALALYQKAMAANPAYLEPLNNFGALVLEDERTQEAAETLNKALRINPNYAEAICNMGGVHLVLEENETALAFYQRALALRPIYIEAQMGLAKALQAQENLQAAEAAALQALKIGADNPKAHALMGGIYTELTHPDLAEKEYAEALRLDPECDDALLGLGHLYTELGKMDKAEDMFQQALKFQPDNLAARVHIARVKKVKTGDENFAALLEEENRLPDLSDNRKMSLHFALGKCYDDTKDYDHAFPHFIAGCKLKRAKLSYDAAAAGRQFAALMEILDRDTIDRLRGAGDPSARPIFVLGMPRSGTTLTEQIIASHPDVFGAGELQDLLRIAHRNITGTTDPIVFPDNFRSLDHATLTAWGAEYVSSVTRRAPDAKHITDKMPANFFAVGLIHLMLPNAKIIHVRRNPVDNCISCFTNLFKRAQEFTYDLGELGEYYVRYAHLMEHWRNVLPMGAFLDVQYEDIVADQEAQARRLIDYCGLEWNDACLDFHNTERPIRTASVVQVRQPIYNTSVERWRHYEKFIGPLLEALGDLVPGQPRLPRHTCT